MSDISMIYNPSVGPSMRVHNLDEVKFWLDDVQRRLNSIDEDIEISNHIMCIRDRSLQKANKNFDLQMTKFTQHADVVHNHAIKISSVLSSHLGGNINFLQENENKLPKYSHYLKEAADVGLLSGGEQKIKLDNEYNARLESYHQYLDNLYNTIQESLIPGEKAIKIGKDLEGLTSLISQYDDKKTHVTSEYNQKLKRANEAYKKLPNFWRIRKLEEDDAANKKIYQEAKQEEEAAQKRSDDVSARHEKLLSLKQNIGTLAEIIEQYSDELIPSFQTLIQSHFNVYSAQDNYDTVYNNLEITKAHKEDLKVMQESIEAIFKGTSKIQELLHSEEQYPNQVQQDVTAQDNSATEAENHSTEAEEQTQQDLLSHHHSLKEEASKLQKLNEEIGATGKELANTSSLQEEFTSYTKLIKEGQFNTKEYHNAGVIKFIKPLEYTTSTIQKYTNAINDINNRPYNMNESTDIAATKLVMQKAINWKFDLEQEFVNKKTEALDYIAKQLKEMSDSNIKIKKILEDQCEEFYSDLNHFNNENNGYNKMLNEYQENTDKLNVSEFTTEFIIPEACVGYDF